MLRRLTSCILFLFIILSLAGCAKYKSERLVRPSEGFVQDVNNVKVITKKLTKGDCDRYFCSHAATKKYEPIQIYIENNGTQLLVFDSKNISLPIENKKVLYNLMSKGIASRYVLYTTGTVLASVSAFLCGAVLAAEAISVFCVPYCCPESSGLFCAESAALASAASIIAVPIIGAFDISAATKYNKNLYKDLNEKLICNDDSFTIPINGYINRVMFINKKNFKEEFFISVIGKNGNPIARFDCKIQ